MVKALTSISLFLALTVTAIAGPSSEVDWLTTFELAPGDTVAVWSLVDSFAVHWSSFSDRDRRQYERGHLEDARHMFINKGDYLRVYVYLKEGSTWNVTSATQVVFSYREQDLRTVEILFPTAARDAVKTSTGGVVLGLTDDLMRSRDGSYRGYLRFAPGSLPRPARGFFFGGNRWGVMAPDSVAVEKGGVK